MTNGAKMTEYANYSGNSSVVAYDYGTDAIIVVFKSRKAYEYRASNVGFENIRQMIALARAGQGLCSFIQRDASVRNGWSRKYVV